MFTFKAYCEAETCSQKYAWFYIDDELLKSLTTDELALVYIETKDDLIHRCFYPASKFYTQQSADELKRRLIDAMSKGSDDEMYKLIVEINKQKGNKDG